MGKVVKDYQTDGLWSLEVLEGQLQTREIAGVQVLSELKQGKPKEVFAGNVLKPANHAIYVEYSGAQNLPELALRAATESAPNDPNGKPKKRLFQTEIYVEGVLKSVVVYR